MYIYIYIYIFNVLKKIKKESSDGNSKKWTSLQMEKVTFQS